jgi:uncharacterized protein (DUF1697 family)
MPAYIALLRGINVGPHKRMKMERLRACCEALGLQQVKTYIQSGNVVFQAGKFKPEIVSKKIEDQILSDFGFSVDINLRTQEELERTIHRNPLLKERGVDESKLHVAFLSEVPPPDALKRLQSLTQPPDRVGHSGKDIYFYFPNGVSGSSLWKHPLDRVLSVSATMRNWKTVKTLHQMAIACG